MIDRRTFLAGLGATAAVAAAPFKAMAETLCPTLWCDGQHDDGPALQAIFNGRSHRRADSTRLMDVRIVHGTDRVLVMGGYFTVKSTVIVPRDRYVVFANNFVKGGEGGRIEFGAPDMHFVTQCCFVDLAGDDFEVGHDYERFNVFRRSA